MSEEQKIIGEDAEARLKSDVISVMSSRHGRRLIATMLNQVGFMRSTYSPDPHTSYFNEGMRNVGFWLFSLIDAHCPEQFLTMMKEAKQEEEYDRQSTSNRDSE